MPEYINSPLFGAVPASILKPCSEFEGSLTDRVLSKEDKWLIGFHVDQGEPFRLVLKPVKEYRDRYESIVVEGDSEVVQVLPVHRKDSK